MAFIKKHNIYCIYFINRLSEYNTKMLVFIISYSSTQKVILPEALSFMANTVVFGTILPASSTTQDLSDEISK
ncbi:conserved hypothetical protein [Xenorhabdus bovienii str. kraussei Quebec]|uniref:Uncharacterized protein n=1 Tax=Xenorhabdus bovienii str. kraussei Quebec TaxID=1398203 RepID=A0A077PF53_XENBV|nr:conserved hypothetical protein [Xenorhabdus bovienii str. kraussei Quebec]